MRCYYFIAVFRHLATLQLIAVLHPVNRLLRPQLGVALDLQFLLVEFHQGFITRLALLIRPGGLVLLHLLLHIARNIGGVRPIALADDLTRARVPDVLLSGQLHFLLTRQAHYSRADGGSVPAVGIPHRALIIERRGPAQQIAIFLRLIRRDRARQLSRLNFEEDAGYFFQRIRHVPSPARGINE